MAEVYGVKPKMFTKEWWPYFWMYYKVHTILIGFFSLSAIMFVTECATKVHYDLNVVYAGSGYYDSKVTDALAGRIAEVATDADDNGKINVWVEQINFSKGGTNNELDMNMQVKHDVEMSVETYRLYLYDKAEAETMLARDQSGLMYTPVEEWAEVMPGADKLLCDADEGVPYMVDLKDSAVLAEIGMDDSDIYVAVCQTTSQEKLAQNAYKSAVAAANMLVSGK
ncbi:MAG: hypothetical protein IJH37_03820 [Clostridia bacterium]|nr:hypothetical protein [Clostridia bacterium]